MKSKFSLGILIFLIGMLSRLIFFSGETYQLSPDSHGYIGLAKSISEFTLDEYNGVRTPMYPLIILLSNFDLNTVTYIQSMMGIIISVLLSIMIYNLTKNFKLTLIVGILYNLYLPFVFTELKILTEVPAAFFVTISFYLISKLVIKINNRTIFFLAIATSMAALTRPLYLVLFIIFGIYLLTKYKSGLKQIIILYFLPSIIILGAWSSVNYVNNDTFNLTTASGFNLTNRVGGFIEAAYDENPTLVSIYLKHRENIVKETGTYAMTIWGALSEMQDSTGLKYAQLSKKMKNVCIIAGIREPLKLSIEWLKGFVRFWKPVGIPFKTKFSIYRYISKYIERPLFLLLEIIFLLSPLLILFRRESIFKINDKLREFFVLIYVSTIIISVFQSLVEYGSKRFSFPTDPLILLYSILWLFSISQYLRKNIKFQRIITFKNRMFL